MASSFESATDLVRRFANTLSREHAIIYDPYTMTMKVLDSLDAVQQMSAQVSSQTTILNHALQSLTIKSLTKAAANANKSPRPSAPSTPIKTPKK